MHDDAPQLPDETFVPAAAGTRVRVVTWIVGMFFVVVVAIQAAVMPRRSMTDYWVGVGAPLAGLPIVAAVWWFSRIRLYRIHGDTVVVERPVFSVRFSLTGFVSAEPDRDALKGARRIRGNDGLGAVSGTFRSARLGRFRVYATDGARGVVVRAAAGTLVVSPAHPEIFADAVKRRMERADALGCRRAAPEASAMRSHR